jgi:hypothetical protein
MWWIIGGAAAALAGVWFATPAIWTFLRRDFEPTRRNDASVFQAQQSAHP